MGTATIVSVATGPDGGLGVVYATQQPPEIHFLVVDAAGSLRGAPRLIGTGPNPVYSAPTAAIAASTDGYGLVWRESIGTVGHIRFARTDLAGREQVAARTISPPVPPGIEVGASDFFAPETTAIVSIDGGYLTAWVEMSGVLADGGWSVVRLARLDPSGVVHGEAPPLRAAVASIDEVEPALIPFGDRVAVLWGRGRHIYKCQAI